MNSKVLSGLFILALLVNGCISEFNAVLPSNDEQILIVEGNVVGNTSAIFYLSKSFPLNALSIPVESFDIDANLTIIGNNGYKSPPALYLGKGAYSITIGELDDNVEYGIQIEYGGDTYQSVLSKPFHTPEIDSVSWIQPEESGVISFRVSTHDDMEGAKFFVWDYTENWEIRVDYFTTIFFNPVDSIFFYDFSAPYYYCWKSSTSNKFLIGSTESLSENRIINKTLYQCSPESDRFSELYSFTVTQRAISKSAFDYYQNKILLNDEMGGLFTPQPAELRGNIICSTDPSKKVMGYVEVVKKEAQKRIFVYPSQVTYPKFFVNCDAISNDSIFTAMEENGFTYAYFYKAGYRPTGDIDMRFYPEIVPLIWARSVCTDCIAKGGTKNKPDFWPNNHE